MSVFCIGVRMRVSLVNTVVYEQLDFAIKDDTMFKAYIQEQVITVINKILRQEKEQNNQ